MKKTTIVNKSIIAAMLFCVSHGIMDSFGAEWGTTATGMGTSSSVASVPELAISESHKIKKFILPPYNRETTTPAQRAADMKAHTAQQNKFSDDMDILYKAFKEKHPFSAQRIDNSLCIPVELQIRYEVSDGEAQDGMPEYRRIAIPAETMAFINTGFTNGFAIHTVYRMENGVESNDPLFMQDLTNSFLILQERLTNIKLGLDPYGTSKNFKKGSFGDLYIYPQGWGNKDTSSSSSTSSNTL